MRILLFATLVVLAGCTCQLSGTPLDTMEKQLNPACWSWCDDEPPPAAPPVPPPAD